MKAFFIRQWFLIALGGVLLFAVLLPQVAAPGGPLFPHITVHIAIAAAFFVSGLTLPTTQLRSAAGQWRLHSFVQLFCFALVPLLVLPLILLIRLLDLPAALGDGFIILGCLPTTIASCVIYTRAAGGNEAGALCNSVGGNIIGLLLTPVLIVMFLGTHGDAPMSAVLRQLSFEVILPIIIGQILRLMLKVPSFPRLRHVPSILLLYIILCVFSATFALGVDSTLIKAACWSVIMAAVLHAVFLGLSWSSSAWSGLQFTRADRIAALFCSTQKTMALGVPLVSVLYAHHPNLAWLTLPLIVYHPLQLFVGGVIVSRLVKK
jgi:solute carrier family 10 (sodium/bile acid cotransporter), member 7